MAPEHDHAPPVPGASRCLPPDAILAVMKAMVPRLVPSLRGSHTLSRRTAFTRSGWCLAAAIAFGALAAVLAGRLANGAEAKGSGMSYREVREFLARHTRVVELKAGEDARVAICPAWQGRVMTSTCAGLDAPSFGFINREFIESGREDAHFNNHGGEDRLWLSPEGGQFSLWFKPGAPQDLSHWFTPAALNEGAFEVLSRAGEPLCRMGRRMEFQNASATDFDLAVLRDVRLLGAADLAGLFGSQAAGAMSGPGVKIVAYETINTIANQGPAMTKAKGLVSIWMLGMLNAGPKTVVVVPYKAGEEIALGPVVKSDYFGPVPPDRLKVLPEAILFRADGSFRSKIGTSQKRAKNVLGSIDFAGNTLTLVHFSMPDDPTQHAYLNNMWEVPQSRPFVGDVANAYNDGPPAPGQKGLGSLYEIESLSRALELGKGQSLRHQHRTVHLQAEPAVLVRLAREILGVEFEAVRRAMQW